MQVKEEIKVILTKHTQREVEGLQNLIDRLYNNDIKTQLNNLEDASTLISVVEGNEVLGFVAIYETIEGFLTLGNYQCIDDDSVVDKLFEKAKQFAKAKGYQKLIGPINGNTWHSYRFSTKKTPTFFLEHHHKSYYLKQWKKAGFKPHAEYFTFQESLGKYIPNHKNLNWLADKPQLSVRHFNVVDAGRDLSLLHQFCSEAFSNNLLYTPINESAFKALYQPILPYLKNDFIDLVIEQNGDVETVVGFLFAVEDIYEPTRLIVKTIARKPGETYKGLAHFLAERLLLKAANKGYQKLLHAYMESQNKSVKMSKKFGGKAYQDHVLLSLSL